MEKDYVKEDIIDHEFYSFRQLIQEDVEEAAWLTSQRFSEKEPVTKALGITAEEFYTYALPLAQRSAECGLGVVAKERSSDVLVGCALNIPDGDPVLEERLRYFPPSEKFGPFLEISMASRDGFVCEESAAYNVTSAVIQNAFSQTHFYLMKATEIIAISKKYDFFVGDVTHPASYKSSVNLNDVIEVGSVICKNFEYKGQYPFANSRYIVRFLIKRLRP